MDPFRAGIAILPLACYGLFLGALNLRRRPVLIGGLLDLAALGIAVSGLILVGPMELFMPEAAASRFGSYIWVLLLLFYGLSLSLAVLVSRHRLVVYNVNLEQLRPVVSRVAQSLDPETRWAGDSLALPQLGVQLRLDEFAPLRNVSLVANGERQSFEGWLRLERELSLALRETQQGWSRMGLGILTASLLLIAACLAQMIFSPQELAQGMREMLRL